MHNTYPNLNLGSKNEIAKRISGRNLPYRDALSLINLSLKNFDTYWYDSKHSEPIKKKFVRSAVGSSLGILLKLIDKKILAPNDALVPNFIFGGLSKRNHVQAAKYLLGYKKDRILLGLDIKSFFEQISEKRVFCFFYNKCNCSKRAAKILAYLCCVPLGPKGSFSNKKILARGFATSARLALWCNLDIFLKLSHVIHKKLKRNDPRIAIFIDDIGITASKISKEKMEIISKHIEHILNNYDPNQKLPLNLTKKKICSGIERKEHLGLNLGRKKLSFGNKSQSKSDKVKILLRSQLSKAEKEKFLKKSAAYNSYRKYIS